MVGKGVLYECLDHPEVKAVLALNRESVRISHPKLKEILIADFFNIDSIKSELGAYDACFFCAGVSSAPKGHPVKNRFIQHHVFPVQALI